MARKSLSQEKKDLDKRIEKYTDYMTGINGLAISDIHENFTLEDAKDKSRNGIITIKTNNGLQNMIAAQMLSLHELQQTTIAMAKNISDIEYQKYYINSAVKLSNVFTQQATLLAKLQGLSGQKVIVERVDVQNGGQAIVGNINTKQGSN